jgi:hypothetical protein
MEDTGEEVVHVNSEVLDVISNSKAWSKNAYFAVVLFDDSGRFWVIFPAFGRFRQFWGPDFPFFTFFRFFDAVYSSGEPDPVL